MRSSSPVSPVAGRGCASSRRRWATTPRCCRRSTTRPGSRGSRRRTSRSSRCPTWTTRAPICSPRTSSGCGAGEAGVVLTGVSAGSICWHVGGTTDSFGPELRPVTDGLGLLPYANGVHYDSEEQRRPLLHRLVADQTLPTAYATDDGVGLHYRGTELVEALTEIPGKGAYRVERGPDGQAVETRLETRLLS